MIIYLTIASLYASKPSKIPSSSKVGKELYEQYCSGCHGKVKKENIKKENIKKENSERTDNSNTQNTDNLANLPSQTQRSSIDTLSVFPKQSTSTTIEFKDKKEVPSLLKNSYTENEWIRWVLVGEGMMPGYSEILHSTDAIKIKTYLDGL